MASQNRQIPLRVLIVEDSDDDAQLLMRQLKKGDYLPSYQRVQSAQSMQQALTESDWDLVLADNSMPGFSALAALEVLKSSRRDVPFIIVSGQIEDSAAVAAMKAGAQDYLLKDNLARLLPAIERELREAAMRASQRRTEEELRFHAYHDPLTGLLNRREFEHRLEVALDLARREQERHILCYLDLDQFKLVNDTCGHSVGDEMLKQLAALLHDQLRASDILARLGGDEFGLLLERCNAEDAQRVVEKLRDAVAAFRFLYDGRSFDIGVSIGMVEISPQSRSVSELLSAADVACYTAKELGRNRSHLYQNDDADLAHRRSEMQWAGRITSALDQNRLVLYHQPIIPLRDGLSAPPAVEILCRLLGEDGKLVPPGSFIPAAERYKLMPAVDRAVIGSLFRHLRDRGSESRLYFVNLSGASISDDSFLGFVQDALSEYGIAPESICFEVTESAAISNLSRSLHFFNGLKSLGCSFALDDFGSGLSSFGYLKNLPVDYLKIDGSFIRDLPSDPIDYAMVEAIHKIGHVMNLKTVAEWVETEQTLELLREIGIDYGQGYGIAVPAPLD